MPVQVINKQVLFSEGDSSNKIYFVKTGQIQVSRKTERPKQTTKNNKGLRVSEEVEADKTLKPHCLGIMQKGQMLGLEECIIGASQQYQTTATCISAKADLFSVDKELFFQIFKQTSHWEDFVKKSTQTVCKQGLNLESMQRSNLRVIN